jgi:hypothetical protein
VFSGSMAQTHVNRLPLAESLRRVQLLQLFATFFALPDSARKSARRLITAQALKPFCHDGRRPM